ncbi:MAG: hypothetical protein COA43_10395 [Robiginitomaculum sp.]|nr:MAG: hypothetical protein COA43_10395 [Robiginitomaculum sp.]
MTITTADYIRGEMPIDGHTKTFTGFAKATSFSCAMLIVLLLMPVLVFCAHIAWFPSLIATFVVGVLIKPAFKLGNAWYGVLIGLAVLAFLIGVFVSAIVG